jgi:hypothetical protein
MKPLFEDVAAFAAIVVFSGATILWTGHWALLTG